MKVKLYLRRGWECGLIAATTLLFFLFISVSYAQNPPAMPVGDVTKEAVPDLGKAPIVVELFSSQACVFCPKADRLFADIIKQDNVIGLACHIDYFDVKTGSLAKSFCTDRQSWYMDKLFAGPNYTPQIVINGDTDVVGYKMDEVIANLQKASYSEVKKLDIAESDSKGTYIVHLPQNVVGKDENYKLWLALYDKPHKLVIADGFNKGKKATYYNIVSELGSTGELKETVYVTPPLKKTHKGFTVLLQDMESGSIIAAGKRQK